MDTDFDLTGAVWRKSSRSGPYSDNCVEVAPAWRKSSRSALSQDCVEAAEVPDGVAVRDSQHPDGPVLLFTPDTWRAFIQGAKGGEFDL